MIFDDHDVRDDWNTSAVWRAQMAEKPWWRERIRSALASYWVYQHLGNLPAEELAADPDYRAVIAAEGDTWPLLAALADRADAEADGSKGVRFSFRWDLGATRFIMIDSRNGRILDDGAHLMLGDEEFGWIEEQVRDRSGPGRRAPRARHVAAVAAPARDRRPAERRPARGGPAGVARPARRDDAPGRRPGALAGVPPVVRPAHPDGHGASRPGPTRRRRVSVLSGDVHHSYAARVDLPGSRRRPRDRGAVGGAPAHLLAGAQRRRLVHPARVPPGLVARRSRRLTRRWAERAGRAAGRRGVAQARRAAVRQHDRHARAGRAARGGDVRAAAVGGVAGARSRGSSWPTVPRRRRAGDRPRRRQIDRPDASTQM